MIRSLSRRLAPALFLAPLLGACASLTPPAETTSATAPVTVRIIGMNDFHGNLLPRTRGKSEGAIDDAGTQVQSKVGGAAVVATAIRELRAQNEYSLVVSAGDLISASPLVSSLFLDEPTISVMNTIGLDYNAVGNHEFDRGWHELLRMQNGGCEKYGLREPCQVENPFKGADFQFLAANVKHEDGSTLFPAYGISRFGEGAGQVSIAVIGLPLHSVPELVTPSGVAELDFGDEAAAVNALIPEIEAKGADAIIVSIHQGFDDNGKLGGAGDPGGCGGVGGALRSIVEKLDPRVDLVISGHTHKFYVCDFGEVDPAHDMLVTSAGYGSAMLTDIALTIDPAANEVIGEAAQNVLVQTDDPAFRQFTPDPAIEAYVARYQAASAAVSERPVGRISGPAYDSEGEGSLADLIADAQLAATRAEGAQLAFMNPGGVRADLIPAADGSVTFGQLYATQPFGNVLITIDMTGAQIASALEQQFANESDPQVLSPSANVRYTIDPSKPAGQQISGFTIDGKPVDPAQTYRVTINNFLAGGGDGFTVFTGIGDQTVGPNDLDAFEAYIDSEGGREVPKVGRVTVID